MKLFKGRYEIAGIIGGIILILLAVWVVLSHYVPGLGLYGFLIQIDTSSPK